MVEHRPASYRRMIDALVSDCATGQGRIGPDRVLTGVWHPEADQGAANLADQREMNRILEQLSTSQRRVLAQMLMGEFVGGVFTTLRQLHDNGIEPFDDGYEGSPYEDFMGRVTGWNWPEDRP